MTRTAPPTEPHVVARTPVPAVWLHRVVTVINSDLGLAKRDAFAGVPGRTVVTVDGSDKGGISFVSTGLRLRWSALGHSQFGVHPFGIAKIKEKYKALRYLPLFVFLRQSGYIPACSRGLRTPPPQNRATRRRIPALATEVGPEDLVLLWTSVFSASA